VVSKANTEVRLSKQTNNGALCKLGQAPLYSLCVHSGMCNNKDACERKAAALKRLHNCLLQQPYKPVTETEFVLNCSESRIKYTERLLWEHDKRFISDPLNLS
jgi:hypothetical protein